MPELPIMPVNVQALLADTMHFDTEEFGAYVKILLNLWEHGGRIREDDLQKICGLSRFKFAKSREKICRPLTIIDGVVSQKRLEDFRLKVKAARQKASVAAEARWVARRAKTQGNGAFTEHMPHQSRSNAIKIRKEERYLPVLSEHEDTPVEKKTHPPSAQPVEPPEVASEVVAIEPTAPAPPEPPRRVPLPPGTRITSSRVLDGLDMPRNREAFTVPSDAKSLSVSPDSEMGRLIRERMLRGR